MPPRIDLPSRGTASASDPYAEFTALARVIPALNDLLDEVRMYAAMNVSPDISWFSKGGTRDRIYSILRESILAGVALPAPIRSWPQAEVIILDRMIAELLSRPAALARAWGGVH